VIVYVSARLKHTQSHVDQPRTEHPVHVFDFHRYLLSCAGDLGREVCTIELRRDVTSSDGARSTRMFRSSGSAIYKSQRKANYYRCFETPEDWVCNN